MDIYKEGKVYVYQCYKCSHLEKRTRVVDGQSCEICKRHTRLIALINHDDEVIVLEASNEIINKNMFRYDKQSHDNIVKAIEQLKPSKSKRGRVRQIDSEASVLKERMAQLQADVDSLSKTNTKSNELLYLLLDTKPEAEKTMEVLGDTIINNDKRIVRHIKEIAKIKAEAIDLLLEKNSILLELKRKED